MSHSQGEECQDTPRGNDLLITLIGMMALIDSQINRRKESTYTNNGSQSRLLVHMDEVISP